MAKRMTALAHDDQHDEGGQQRQVGGHGEGVDQHPDGDEEHRHEDVAQRQQARDGLVRVVGGADDEPGQEGPERDRQPHRLREGAGAEPDGEDDEQEQARRSAFAPRGA